jgi:hypothetical protein
MRDKAWVLGEWLAQWLYGRDHTLLAIGDQGFWLVVGNQGRPRIGVSAWVCRLVGLVTDDQG